MTSLRGGITSCQCLLRLRRPLNMAELGRHTFLVFHTVCCSLVALMFDVFPTFSFWFACAGGDGYERSGLRVSDYKMWETGFNFQWGSDEICKYTFMWLPFVLRCVYAFDVCFGFRARRKSRIHVIHGSREFWRLPWIFARAALLCQNP